MSVLFADLVGFTSMAEGRDPESVKEMLDECFGLLVPIVEAHGGYLDKLIGDELMATFGAPVAHQDDPLRAVHTSFELNEVLATSDFDLRLRIGINTGEVLAGAVGPGGAYTVTGDAVNTAHRLAEHAEPGQVIVGEGTWSATNDSVTYESLEPVELKGKAEPVHLWIATGLRRVTTEVPSGVVRPELVGREQELAWLTETVQAALSTSRPVVVSIAGEAGVGKTRLVDEMLERLEPGNQKIVKVKCRPYGGVQRVASTADVVRGLLGISGADPLEMQMRTVRERASELAANAQVPSRDLTDRLALVLDPSVVGTRQTTLSVTGGWTTWPSNPSSVLRPLLVGLARSTPTVLILDDLHWADAGLLGVLESMPFHLGDAPVVIVALGRTELIDRRPVLFAGQDDLLAVVLQPLGDDEARDLLQSLLDNHAVDTGRESVIGPDTEDHVLDAAGGNPLLLDQLVSFLADRGDLTVDTGQVGVVSDTDEIMLPDGIRALLWARIDGLPPSHRRFLIDAAIVGTRFWPELVADLGGIDDPSGLLEDLVARGLIEPVADQGDGTYGFRHRLARDAAYAAVPLAERAQKHGQIARWIEATPGESFEHRISGIVAHHVEQAVLLNRELEHTDPGLATGAFRTLLRAGSEAERFESMREAERWYRRAIRLGTFDIADQRSASLCLARVLIHRRDLDEAIGLLDELVVGLTNQDGDTDLLAEVTSLRAVSARLQGNVEDAGAKFATALDLRRDDRLGQSRILRQAGWAELMSGRPRSALPRLRRAAELLDDGAGPGDRGESLRYLGWSGFLVGEPGATQDLLLARELLMEAGDIGAAQWCGGILGFLRLQQGEVGEVIDITEQLIAEIHRRGESWSESTCTLLLAAAKLEAGDTIEAASLLDHASRWFLELGDQWGQAVSELVGGMIARATGNLDRARYHLQRGIMMAPEVAYLGEESRLLVELARVDLDDGDFDASIRRSRSTLARVRSGVGDADSEVRALACMAEAMLRSGEVLTAMLTFEEAVVAGTGFADFDGTVSVATRQAMAHLASLQFVHGDPQRAQEMLERASTGPGSSLRTQVLIALARADAADVAGDVDGAREALDTVLSQFPRSSHVLLDTVRERRGILPGAS